MFAYRTFLVRVDRQACRAVASVVRSIYDAVTMIRRQYRLLPIKDRRYRLRVYPQCFVESEAVDWMSDRFRMSREEAVKLGQRLMDAEHIHHVADDRKFKDRELFYRFYWDENN